MSLPKRWAPPGRGLLHNGLLALKTVSYQTGAKVTLFPESAKKEIPDILLSLNINSICMLKKILILCLAAAALMTACRKDPEGLPAMTVDLSKLTADACPNGEFIVQDGMVLTGTLDGLQQKVKITIDKGATVTLSNAAILAEDTGWNNTMWAGITCAGDATIILVGDNAVHSFNREYPAIQAGPEGSTLTILGEGSLTATSVSTGIGSSLEESCGNIRIEGGTITAGVDAGGGAGIGSDVWTSCGDISISGNAVVTAAGSSAGAGIGSGEAASCGDISISGNAVVTATGGCDGDAAGIGCGDGGMCGNITISGGTVWARGIGKAAGIGGGGRVSWCGDISILRVEDFGVSVTAIRGDSAQRSIGFPYGNNGERSGGWDSGSGLDGVCGRIMFGGTKVFGGEDYAFFTVPEDGQYGNLLFEKSTTPFSEEEDIDYTDNTWTLTANPE